MSLIQQELPTLIEFLHQLAAGLWVPVIVSFLLEHFDWFQRLTSEQRKWGVVAIFLLLPLASQLLIQFVPNDVWVILNPYWRSLGLGFLGWLGSQVAHQYNKRSAG